MNIDFSQLLGNLLGGVQNDMALGKRKPNAPPPLTLMPSQEAFASVEEGAAEALRGSRGHEPPSMGITHDAGAMAPMQDGLIQTEREASPIQRTADDPQLGQDGAMANPQPQLGQNGVMASFLPPPQVVGAQQSPVPSNDAAASPLETNIADRQKRLLDTQKELKDHPSSKWKNIGAGLLQGANNFLNNRNDPIRSYDQIRYDANVTPIEKELATLQGQQDIDTKRKDREAQTAYTLSRPQAAKDALDAKFDLETQKQLGRIQALVEKRRLAGLDTRVGTAKDGSGMLVTIDKNGKETPFKDPDTGEQLYNKLERPEAQQIEDGKNPDGTTKHRTIYAKGSQILSNDSMTKYRDAMVKLGQGRLEETKRGNQVREKLAQQHFDVAKQQWNDTMALRQQTETRMTAAQAAGNAAEAARLQLALDKYDSDITNMRVNWKKGIGTGGFTGEDYEELTGEKPD